ncbi:MAG: hypothetical protein JNL13_06010 [Chitinophagaceae bacterium]|nr:hypothetical protein [Chitinophagaceae bacterium]
MRYLLKYLAVLLLCTLRVDAQEPDTRAVPGRQYSFTGIMPSFAGIISFGQPQTYADVYIPGMSLSYGKAKDELRFGAALGYRHYFIEAWKDANECTIGPFIEYHFRPAQKATWMAGLKTYVLVWQYTPQTPTFRFFNDPLDGKSRLHFIPVVFPYIGGDFKVKKKYHLVLAAGYNFTFRSLPWVFPFAGSFGMVVDFRIPLCNK